MEMNTHILTIKQLLKMNEKAYNSINFFSNSYCVKPLSKSNVVKLNFGTH